MLVIILKITHLMNKIVIIILPPITSLNNKGTFETNYETMNCKIIIVLFS